MSETTDRSCGRKEEREPESGAEGGSGERRRFRRYSSHASPPGFFPASGYLLIGYSKISETRRYRRKKRGDAREKTREPEEERKEDERPGRRRGRKRGHTGGRVVADRTREWGLTTTTPQRRGFLFVPREFLFVSFPVTRPHPPTIRELRFLHSPLPPAHPLSSSFSSSSSSSSSSSISSSYHRPPKIRVRYYLSPDRSLARPPPRARTSSSALSFLSALLYHLCHGRSTITGPRTI